jgi:hypothetical protein
LLKRCRTCIFFVCFVGCSFLACQSALAQQHHHHHPPWQSPVAWSQTLNEGGSAIRLDVAPGPLDLSHAQIVDWVDTAARAVAEYFGKFPVPRARVLLVPVANKQGILAGTTWGAVDGLPAFTRIFLGQHTTQQELTRDWILTFEFVHIGLPSVPPDGLWTSEGLSTWVEPIARAQIGAISPEQAWEESVPGMSRGEPRPGEQGLDRTQTWAATYWGGALFWMMADIGIREATHNRKGLQDALRGVVAAGGSIAVNWPISKVMAVGDRATGTAVLTDLYSKMGEHSFAPVDLTALWKSLGIRQLKGKVAFDNQAPLAPIRQAITRPELFLPVSGHRRVRMPRGSDDQAR